MSEEALPLLCVKEAASYLRVRPPLVYALIASGKGPPVKRVGRLIRLPAEKFYRWANRPDNPLKRANGG